MDERGKIEALVIELREAAEYRQQVAWSRLDGGQEWSLTANLANAAADMIEDLFLRATGTGRAEAEAAGKSGLSNAELEAEALRYQAIAAEQGSTIMRLRIAMKLLTESGHGGAIHTARKWFASGGTGPIPWPGGACFAAWAEEQGYSEVDGCVGFRATARALPVQTAGGAE